MLVDVEVVVDVVVVVVDRVVVIEVDVEVVVSIVIVVADVVVGSTVVVCGSVVGSSVVVVSSTSSKLIAFEIALFLFPLFLFFHPFQPGFGEFILWPTLQISPSPSNPVLHLHL